MEINMDSFIPVIYEKQYETSLFAFLEICLPESGRALDLSGRHAFYLDIPRHFRVFWCMFDGDAIVGTVGIRDANAGACELKSLYLLEKYHGKGYGRRMLETALDFAKKAGYRRIYLDSLSTSTRAIRLYRRAGFTDTERYNDAERSDVFMVKELQ